jgi:hypothetical protein
MRSLGYRVFIEGLEYIAEQGKPLEDSIFIGARNIDGRVHN